MSREDVRFGKSLYQKSIDSRLKKVDDRTISFESISRCNLGFWSVVQHMAAYHLEFFREKNARSLTSIYVLAEDVTNFSFKYQIITRGRTVVIQIEICYFGNI